MAPSTPPEPTRVRRLYSNIAALAPLGTLQSVASGGKVFGCDFIHPISPDPDVFVNQVINSDVIIPVAVPVTTDPPRDVSFSQDGGGTLTGNVTVFGTDFYDTAVQETLPIPADGDGTVYTRRTFKKVLNQAFTGTAGSGTIHSGIGNGMGFPLKPAAGAAGFGVAVISEVINGQPGSGGIFYNTADSLPNGKYTADKNQQDDSNSYTLFMQKQTLATPTPVASPTPPPGP